MTWPENNRFSFSDRALVWNATRLDLYEGGNGENPFPLPPGDIVADSGECN